MGNCLVIQDRKEIKMMRVEGGKVLQMSLPPLKVLQEEGLAEPQKSTGHSTVPRSVLPAPAAVVADPGAAVRVKLVISKQELKRMLDKEGMSLDDMVSVMRKEAVARESEQHECCGGWRPALESIPEGSGF
jgi:hypothetical protein